MDTTKDLRWFDSPKTKSKTNKANGRTINQLIRVGSQHSLSLFHNHYTPFSGVVSFVPASACCCRSTTLGACSCLWTSSPTASQSTNTTLCIKMESMTVMDGMKHVYTASIPPPFQSAIWRTAGKLHSYKTPAIAVAVTVAVPTNHCWPRA